MSEVRMFPSGKRVGRPPKPPIERFMRFVLPDPETGCWRWLSGHDRDGYAMFFAQRGATPRAARFIYLQTVGSIPDAYVIDHLCRNRGCVNPAHLEPVTNRENILRGRRPLGERKHCPRGHEFTEANTYRPPNGRGRVCRRCHADYEFDRRARIRAAA